MKMAMSDAASVAITSGTAGSTPSLQLMPGGRVSKLQNTLLVDDALGTAVRYDSRSGSRYSSPLSRRYGSPCSSGCAVVDAV